MSVSRGAKNPLACRFRMGRGDRGNGLRRRDCCPVLDSCDYDVGMRSAIRTFVTLAALGILAVAIFVEHDWGFIGVVVFTWVVINGIAALARRQRLRSGVPIRSNPGSIP